MTILAPKNRWEFAERMQFAVAHKGPVAMRYPRGNVDDGLQEFQEPIISGKSEVIAKEQGIAIFGSGHMMETAEQVWKILKEKGYACSLINSRFVKPMDTAVLEEMSEGHQLFVTIEEATVSGGYGANVMKYVSEQNMAVKVLNLGVPDIFVEHGNISQLRKLIGLDSESIVEKIVNAWENQ